MRQSFNSGTRTLWGSESAMSALAAIRDDLRERIPRTVERESAKVIALKVGTTPRCIENWRQRESLPSVPAFIMLAKNDSELRAWVLHELDYEDARSGQWLSSPIIFQKGELMNRGGLQMRRSRR